MEEESERKINPENPQNHEDEQRKEEPSAKPSSERRPDAPKDYDGRLAAGHLICALFAQASLTLLWSSKVWSSRQG